MNNILLVGNGFDLAHGLRTKYEHFLYLMKHWDEFYDAYKKEREIFVYQGEKNNDLICDFSLFSFMSESQNSIDRYIKNVSRMEKTNIDKLGKIIKNNSWISYYCNCEAEIDGWIDFEREVYPVIDMFEFVFSCEYIMRSTVSGKVNIIIPKKELKVKHLIIVELWKKYFTVADAYVYLNDSYVSQNYGILKKKILADLRREFDEFIQAFEIYLHEFVYTCKDVKPLAQINELGINMVISFNYTSTEKIYGVTEANVHHIHGIARENLSKEVNNMVMGVSESPEQNIDFIYFTKYFQRLRKKSGVKYKELLERRIPDGHIIHTDSILYIYGHSLDVTDADILKYVIGDKDKEGKMKMMPKSVVVFYHDDDDFEQKVINLIKLFGRDIIEEYMERKRFVFIKTKKDVEG